MQRRERLGVLAAVALVLAGFGAGLPTAGALTNCTVDAADQAVDSEEQQMLNLINQYRAANNKNTLALSTDATRAAAWFADDMADFNYFPPNHVDRLGRDIPTRLTQCDVPWIQYGENIAAGNATASATFEQWRLSPTHNAIMLSDGITHAGIARDFNAAAEFDWYWVLDVINPGAAGTTTTSSTTTTSTSSTTTTSTTSTSTTTTTLPTTTTSSSTTTTAPTTTTSTSSTTTTLPPTTTTSTSSTTTTSLPTVFCDGLQATIVGTSGNDTLTGTEGPDVIVGLGGDDRISGLGGDDVICAGPGADLISGGAGNDTVFGDDGSDTITGATGDDTLSGGAGNDRIDGGSGANVIDGGTGTDFCSAPNTNCEA